MYFLATTLYGTVRYALYGAVRTKRTICLKGTLHVEGKNNKWVKRRNYKVDHKNMMTTIYVKYCKNCILTFHQTCIVSDVCVKYDFGHPCFE